MELSPLAGWEVYAGEEVPAGGIVTGVGSVRGVQCVVVANDSTCVSCALLRIEVERAELMAGLKEARIIRLR